MVAAAAVGCEGSRRVPSVPLRKTMFTSTGTTAAEAAITQQFN